MSAFLEDIESGERYDVRGGRVAELISIANEIGFHPATELAALARRLFAVEHAREMELREELALLDEETAHQLIETSSRG